MAVFDRGDIVNVPLDLAQGHEQKGTRPALVLITKAFNKLGDVLVALLLKVETSLDMLALQSRYQVAAAKLKVWR